MTATDEPIHYLTPADLYGVAEEAIGHAPAVRDRHLLRKAAARPMTVLFGEEMFPTLFDKAAALLHSLAVHHLFFDGNKRTATAATRWFLELNGFRPTWDQAAIIAYVLAVALKQHDIPAIAAWLADHVVAIPEE